MPPSDLWSMVSADANQADRPEAPSLNAALNEGANGVKGQGIRTPYALTTFRLSSADAACSPGA